jgi:cobalt-zinc-cadmium efflux system membrane fusion protein
VVPVIKRSLLAALALAACAGEPADSPDDHLDVEADTATVAAASAEIAGFTYGTAESLPWRTTWRSSGRIISDPETTSPIGTIVDGRVTEVRVLPGQSVRTGSIIALIHTHEMMDARRELAGAVALQRAAAASADQATRDRERSERLLALRAASTADVERARVVEVAARSAQADANAAVERAEGLVEHLLGGEDIAGLDPHVAVIRSPMDGVVISRSAQPGAVVLLGEPLVTIARSTGLMLELSVPETGVRAATVGATVRFSVPAYPDERFTARVLRVGPALDPVTRTTTLWAAVSDPRGLLRAEMVAQGELAAAAEDTVVVVPAAAVQVLDEQTVVIVAVHQEDGVFLQAQPVRVGRRTTDVVEILAGVDAGASVVVGGASIAKAELLKRRGAFADEH